MRPISEYYPVRTHSFGRYRVTIPERVINQTTIKPGCYVTPSISIDDEVKIKYTRTSSDEKFTYKVLGGRTTEITVPSIFAQIFGLENCFVKWDVEKNNSITANLGFIPVKKQVKPNDYIATKKLVKVDQDVSNRSYSWTQSHFHLYLKSEDMENLNWTPPQCVSLTIILTENGIGILLDKMNSENSRKTPIQKTVYPTNDTESDGIVFIPNSLVQLLGMERYPISLFNLESGLLLRLAK